MKTGHRRRRKKRLACLCLLHGKGKTDAILQKGLTLSVGYVMNGRKPDERSQTLLSDRGAIPMSTFPKQPRAAAEGKGGVAEAVCSAQGEPAAGTLQKM